MAYNKTCIYITGWMGSQNINVPVQGNVFSTHRKTSIDTAVFRHFYWKQPLIVKCDIQMLLNYVYAQEVMFNF